jgi:hypothetical protein
MTLAELQAINSALSPKPSGKNAARASIASVTDLPIAGIATLNSPIAVVAGLCRFP